MKICLINNLFYPDKRGGAEIVTEKIINGLKNRGYDVFVITSKSFAKQAKKAGQNYKIYRLRPRNLISYYNLSILPKSFRLIWHILDIFNIWNYFKINSILNNEKPNLVLTHNLKGLGGFTPLAIKKNNIKHIHTLHDIQLIHPSGLIIFGHEKKIKTFFSQFYSRINQRLSGSPYAVVSPSSWLMKLHNDYGFFSASKKIILPNPTELKPIKNDYIKNKKINFLYAGQIEFGKGLDILITAFEKLCQSERQNNYGLQIVGDGARLNYFKNMVKNQSNIYFSGRVDNKRVLDIMQKSNVLVVPSICYENSPTVIYEALGQNLPVIASRIGGITEIINQFGGLLFLPNNVDDLLVQMKKFINNQDLIKNMIKKNSTKLAELNLDIYLDKLLKL